MRKKLLFAIVFIGLCSISSFAQTEDDSSKVKSMRTVRKQPVEATPAKRVLLDTPAYKDFRLAIGGGYAYRLGEKEKYHDAQLDKLVKDLNHGYNIDIDAQYFFKENWGLGLNLNHVGSSASASDINVPNFGFTSRYKEKNSFTYIGPAFVGRLDLNKFLLTYTVGFGPLFYKNSGEASNMKGSGTKTTFGMNAGIAMEYKLNQSLGAGLKLSYTVGTIGSLDLSDNRGTTEFEDRLSVSNFMITGFLSFRTWK